MSSLVHSSAIALAGPTSVTKSLFSTLRRCHCRQPPNVLIVLLGVLGCLLGTTLIAPPANAGQLHSDADLATIAFLTAARLEPWSGNQKRLLKEARREWRWGHPGFEYITSVDSKGKKTCHPVSDPSQLDYLKNGAPDVYAKALSYRTAHPAMRDVMTGFDARSLLLELAGTSGFHGPDGKDFSGRNQCVLDLAVSVPIWIASAELLEGTGIWTSRERGVFSYWLESEVYPLVAWASRVRRNNWGAAGSLAARMVARYVSATRLVLREESPVPHYLFARDAVDEHDQMQRDRMGTDWAGDSSCPVYGIQPHGGIPDELRRGKGGCAAIDLPSQGDSGRNYQTMHVALLAMHAEVLRHAGDLSLYELQTEAGDPALLQSILFVIDNPSAGGRSWDWGGRTGALRAALRHYEDARLSAAVEANDHLGFRGGRTFPYTQINLRPGPP